MTAITSKLTIKPGKVYQDLEGSNWVIFTAEEFRLVGFSRLNAAFPGQPDKNKRTMDLISERYGDTVFYAICYDRRGSWDFMTYDKFGQGEYPDSPCNLIREV